MRFLAEQPPMQADPRDSVGPVPDHHNKANNAIKWVTQIFWFPSAHKSYYTVVYYTVVY